MPLLRLRNPLIYPGGKPGFNPSHFAAGSNMRFSGVATSNGGFLSLFPGNGKTSVVGTPTAAPTVIGPAAGLTAFGNYFTYPSPNTALSAVTIGAIFVPTSSVSFAVLFTDNGTSTAGNQLQLRSLVLSFSASGGAVSSSITLAVNTPYFIAVSILNGSGSNEAPNYVAANLLTGKIQAVAGSATATTLATPTNSLYLIGSGDFSSGQAGGNLCAVMYSLNNLLSLKQLSAWAAAPWDFWYPPTIQNLILTSLQAPQSAAPAVGIGWQIPFEHRLSPQTTIDGNSFVYNPPAAAAVTLYDAWQIPFEHRPTAASRTEFTPFVKAPNAVTLPPQPQFEHRLTQPVRIDGPRQTTNIATIPAIVSGMAWYQAFEHRIAKPVPTVWDGAWRLSAAIPIPVWWYSAFQHSSTPSVRVDGSTVPWQPVTAVSTIAGIAWQKSFEQRATPPTRVDGTVTPWQPVAVVSTIAGMAWQKSFEHQATAQTRVDGTISPWQPVTAVSTISGMAWFAPFESRLTAAIQADTSSAYYLLPTASPPSSYFFNRFRAAIGARSGTHQQDK